MSTNKAVLGLVSNQAQAEAVVVDLRISGFANSDISVLFPNQSGTRDFVIEQHTKAPEAALAGVGAGGALGGTLGLLVGIGALAIPGFGPFLAAGPILAALSGMAAGAALGGFTGALIGIGIPELEAKQYEGKLKDGKIMISVHVDEPEARAAAKKVLELRGATDIITVGEQTVPVVQAA
jgi:hypothetical protein